MVALFWSIIAASSALVDFKRAGSRPAAGEQVSSDSDSSIPVLIGVLAKRGHQRCLEKWSPTAEYLGSEIPGYGFSIIPLDFSDVIPAVEQKQVDFVLANSSIYARLEVRHGVNRIATLKNFCLGQPTTVFAGVIFCRADRSDLETIADLRGASFMAVEKNSFGGWQMAWRELKHHGLDPHRDFASLDFGGTHDAVVESVLAGEVDAGTVRTDTLERMAVERKIDQEDFKVFHLRVDEEVPFIHSTQVYPEWPMASAGHTDPILAEKVAATLIRMPEKSRAAIAARCAGWTIPHNYHQVHVCLWELKLGPYADFGRITVGAVIRKYRPYLIAAVIGVAGLVLVTLYVIVLKRRIRTSRHFLQNVIDAMTAHNSTSAKNRGLEAGMNDKVSCTRITGKI